MREVKVQIQSINPYKEVVSEYFNLLFGNKSDSKDYWFGEFKSRVQEKFIYCFAIEEASPTFDLRNIIDLKSMFTKLCNKNNIVIQNSAIARFNRLLREKNYKLKKPLFFPEDVLEINPVIKVLKIDPIFQNFHKLGDVEVVYKKNLEIRESYLKIKYLFFFFIFIEIYYLFY